MVVGVVGERAAVWCKWIVGCVIYDVVVSVVEGGCVCVCVRVWVVKFLYVKVVGVDVRTLLILVHGTRQLKEVVPIQRGSLD